MNISMPPHVLSDGTSILVILMGSLGDVVRGLSVVDQLKSNFPSSKVTWLVEPKCQGIVALHSGIDRVILFERGKGFQSLFRLYRELRKEAFDITLDMQRHFKSGFFSFLSRSPRRIGFNKKNSKEGNFIFNNEHLPFRDDSVPKIHHYLDFISALGGEIRQPLSFGIKGSPLREKNAAKFNTIATPVLFFVMGSSWRSKDWPLEGYEGLLRLILTRTSYSVILLGDRSQKDAEIELLKRTAYIVPDISKRVCGFVGETTLGELVTLIGASQAGAGPDSGPGHISGALGKPYVALFGPTSPSRVAPYGSEHLAIKSSVGCSPCMRRDCPGLNTVCMRLLRPEVVFERLFSILKEGYS